MKNILKICFALSFTCMGGQAFAQCSGIFAVGQICGNPSSSAAANPRGTNSPVIGTQLTIGVTGTATGALILKGLTSGTVTVASQATAGTATFTLPNTSGTPAISVPSPLSLSATTGATTWTGLTSDGILFASSSSAVANNRCTMSSDQGLLCISATAFQPQFINRNNTTDANSAYVILQKTRSGGNTSTNDALGNLVFQGFANGGVQNSARILALQSGASSGSNIPTDVYVSTSSTAGQFDNSWIFVGASKTFLLPGDGLVVGGTAAGSTLTFKGTTNGSPSGDHVDFKSGTKDIWRFKQNPGGDVGGVYVECFPGNAAGFQNAECDVFSSISTGGISFRMKGDWPFVIHAPADQSAPAKMCIYEQESNGTNRMCWYANSSIASDFTLVWPSGVPASVTSPLMVSTGGVMSYQAGISATMTVRNAANSGTCTITSVNGIVTATTC